MNIDYKKVEKLAISQENEIESASYGDGKLPLVWSILFLVQHGARIMNQLEEAGDDYALKIKKELKSLLKEINRCIED